MVFNFRKRTCENTFINGPVICIGDFDDSYNMPPPKLPVPETVNTEYDYSKFVSIYNLNICFNINLFVIFNIYVYIYIRCLN